MQLNNEEIEEGIAISIYNSRGAVMRAVGEGGTREWAIAESYREYAGILSDSWPRTTRLMEKIAHDFEADAHREDLRAELEEDLRA